jgi:hypothetical protein
MTPCQALELLVSSAHDGQHGETGAPREKERPDIKHVRVPARAALTCAPFTQGDRVRPGRAHGRRQNRAGDLVCEYHRTLSLGRPVVCQNPPSPAVSW